MRSTPDICSCSCSLHTAPCRLRCCTDKRSPYFQARAALPQTTAQRAAHRETKSQRSKKQHSDTAEPVMFFCHAHPPLFLVAVSRFIRAAAPLSSCELTPAKHRTCDSLAQLICARKAQLVSVTLDKLNTRANAVDIIRKIKYIRLDRDRIAAERRIRSDIRHRRNAMPVEHKIGKINTLFSACKCCRLRQDLR